MNLKKYLLTGIMVAAAASFTVDAALTKDFYKSKSVLSSGNWVKVGVDKTGVFEISYETLREMGFSNPEKVAVYGRGGREMPQSFSSNSGVVSITDDLQSVKVLHEDGKLYFYALGPEEIAFYTSSDYELGGYFTRKSNNIYSRRGYYFLTDTSAPDAMTVTSSDATTAPYVNRGISYIYHELDSVQNTTDSGQLFWGEMIGHPNLQRRKWQVAMPDAVAGKMGVMECHLYLETKSWGNEASVSYGFEDPGMEYFHTPYNMNTTLYYAPHNPTLAEVQVPGKNGTAFVEFIGNDMGAYSNLDFWVVSYESTLPTLTGADGSHLQQQLVALPDISRNSTGMMRLQNSASLVVLDVTNNVNPQRLTIRPNGPDGIVGVKYSSAAPVVVVFDKDVPQYQICGYEKAYNQVANQNLHALKDTGADFIIITSPHLKRYADQIAELHRRHDNMEVVVATTEEVYNEFSGGVPDPMAYRSFAKMLYFSDRKPKNMLLMGPLYGDFRGLHSERDPFEGIIAYQSPEIHTARGAYNINDFYGVMEDKFRTDYYERNPVAIGIATLPIKFESDAKIVVDKIRDYMERTDFAYYLNKYTAISGTGDQHIHDAQIRDINTHIRQLDFFGTIYTPLAIDTYGNVEAQKKFFNRLNEGCAFFTYFGHGAEQFLGKDRNFFNAGDVYKLRNSFLPFAGFGGCQITNTDRGYRGLGETLVTATPYGCIGSLVSTRETWSNQNLEFFKQFFIALYTQGTEISAEHNYTPMTIGEIYARIKTMSILSNELAYQLICDPALIIPTINRKMKVKANVDGAVQITPGQPFSITGQILDKDGNVDTGFNGEAVVRLCEPEKQLPAGNLITGEDVGSLKYYYRDEQIVMAVAEVKDGEFTAEFLAPSSMSNFTGQNSLIYFSAYDPSTRTGAGQSNVIPVGSAHAGTTAESSDKTPPAIEVLEFNPADCSVDLTVSDNLALNLSGNPLTKGLFLYIDGKEHTGAHVAPMVMDTGRAAYSKNVSLEGLAYGEHSLRLKVKDAAGNATEREVIFTYQPTMARYTIVRDRDSAADSTTVMADGEAPDSATLVVLAATGTEIWRGDFKGSKVEWNHRDSAGNKVAPGHYKAYILETGNAHVKGHSETIDIPVI